MVILLMGVAGSGKTTIGQELARELGWAFADADDFHPAANVAKMGSGQPLNDEDRAPWLAALRAYIDEALRTRRNAIVTCSALKEKYRRVLMDGTVGVKLVYLKGSREILWSRLSGREGHFMKSAMLDSQLATLEEPADALVIEIDQPLPAIAAEIRKQLGV